MLKGNGVDIVDIRRIQNSLDRLGKRFVRRILTEAERACFTEKKCSAAWLAKRFAAKEAVVKAFGTGIGAISFQDITVTNNTLGAPGIMLSDRAAAFCHANGIGKIHLSLSDEKHYAIAFVVAESASDTYPRS